MKLEIIIGKEWTSDFTVVDQTGLSGAVLDPSDTATISISTSGVTPECVIEPTAMTIVDANNGLFTVTLPADKTILLEQEVAFAEDLYPTQGNYVAMLDFVLASGNRHATVPIYVKDVGQCPIP